MKASLEIEAIGDNVYQWGSFWTDITDSMVPGLGTMTFGLKHNYWVARITGRDPQYKYQREFLRYRKDYARANSVGSRGIFVYYTLESGELYEVRRGDKGGSRSRYFCTVDLNGEIVEVDQEYVEQWVSEHSEPTSSKLPQSA